MTITANRSRPKLIRHILIAISSAAVLLTVVQGVTLSSQNAEQYRRAFDQARSEALRASAAIDEAFSQVIAIANGIAIDLTNGQTPYTDINSRMRAEFERYPEIDGIAITFQPYAYDADLRLYQQYIHRLSDGSLDVLDGATYDYTIESGVTPDSPNTAWYHAPLRYGAMWNEPFLAAGAGKVLIEYGIPFYSPASPEGVPAGVVTVDYSLDGMRNIMRSLELGTTGYGFVFSTSGTILAHPIQELVAQRSIFDLAEEAGDAVFVDSAHQALAGSASWHTTHDSVTASDSWLFFEPLPATGWGLGLVLNQAEFSREPAEILREQMGIALTAALAIWTTIALLLLPRIVQARPTALWAVSLTFAGLCGILIVVTWILANNVSVSRGIPVTDQATLDQFLDDYRIVLASGEETLTVATGVYVQALDFPDPTSVNFNGYIWQRYPTVLQGEFTEGFSLPGRIGEEAVFEEVYREETDDSITVIWYVGARLRQTYDTAQFPFDRRDITVRIAPADLSPNIVLMPDFDSYSLINPRLLPGMDSDVAINNWQVDSSVFSYHPIDYSATLGIPARAARTTYPELTYTISVRRLFLGPFIAYLLPGVVATAMIFAYLINERKPGDKDEIASMLNYAAALFFVIAVAHNALRESIAAVGITYIEHLYILLYLALGLVLIDTFLVVRHHNLMLVARDNLPAKLLYWPLIASLLLISTLLTFVYR